MTVTDMDAQLAAAKRALSKSEARYKVLTDAMPQMVWSTLPDGRHDYFNAQWYEFTGVPVGSTDGEGWAELFHADDQPRAWERWRHSLATGDRYEVEYRLRHHTGEYRWTLGRAQPVRDEHGVIVRWIGTCTDIHDTKQIAEQNELLSRELSHRIKNIFAVVAGLIAMSARQFPEAKEFARSLRDRIAALGRAHDFVRPHSEHSAPTVGRTTLRGLLQDLFKPYPAFDEGRLVIEGGDIVVDDRGATPLALLFHELSTNAVKYGALSTDHGRVVVDIAAIEAGALITWREQGGPRISGPPPRTGFGTRLAELSIIDQLGGRLHKAWEADGLVVTVGLDQNRLVRGDLA